MKSFDYIIVGAGTSGCVLANRLSQNPQNSVLLVEAGARDVHPYIHIPGTYANNHKTGHDWGFSTEEQVHVNNRKIYLPRGKVMGGCSSTNAMAYVRGNKADYDEWASMGNEGWSYEDVLPLFKKSENFLDSKGGDERYRGKEGELLVSEQTRFRTPYADAFIEACKTFGMTENQDYNGAIQKGVAPFQFTIAKGRRQSGAVAFIKPILKRTNLSISTKSLVERVGLEDNVAKSVAYRKGGKVFKASARKEIIICAGAFQSPQILMLSGIGDGQELTKHNIKTKVDLPGVGKNLQDHLFFGVGASIKKQDALNHYLTVKGQLTGLMQYLISKSGPLNCSPLESVAFLNIDNPVDRVNFQFQFAPLNFGKGYDYDPYDFKTLPRKDGISILPTLLHPKSRGTVSIKSANPTDHPVIQPNFLSEQEDLDQLIKGGELALDILKQESMSRHTEEIVGPLDHSYEGIKDHLLKTVETVYHPVGTCKMGADKMSVVDQNLKVHGIKNLRIADASIMPKIVSGNTNAACFMIGEKAAEMILNTTKMPQKEAV